MIRLFAYAADGLHRRSRRQPFFARSTAPRTTGSSRLRGGFAGAMLLVALGRILLADETVRTPAGSKLPPPRPSGVIARTRDDLPKPPSTDQLKMRVSPLDAEEVISNKRWTLADFESLAFANNPTLVQAEAAVEADRGLYDQVGRYPNPQVGYLRTDNSRADQSQSQGIFVSQEFVTAGKLKKNRNIEAWDIQRLSRDADAQLLRVVNDLTIRYFELLGAQQALAMTKDLERIAREGVEMSQRLLDAKQVARPDVLQARVQFQSVRLNLREAEHRYEAAWGQLASIIGVPKLERAPVVGRLDGPIPSLDWDECWLELESKSPQMAAAESRVQFAYSEYNRERVEPIPNVNVQIVADRDRVTNSNTLSSLVSVPFPVFNRNQGNIRRARAEIQQAEAEVERVRLVLRDLLTDSFRRHQSARDQVTALRDEILPDATEALQLTTAGYKQGELSILDVLAARQTYFQSSLAYVEALTELQKVAIEIDGLQLSGGLNPPEIGTAIQGVGGGVSRQRALLNKLQENTSKRLLPAALQTGR